MFFSCVSGRGVRIITADLQTLCTVCVAPPDESRWFVDLRGSYFSSAARRLQTAFASHALCMDCALPTLPRTRASTWAVAECSCEVSGAVKAVLMAGACCKCPVTLSVFKRSLWVAPRGCSSAPRYQPACWRLGERGLQEASRASSAVRPAGFYRHTASLCLSCQESMSESLRTCYVYLNQTSRSFAAVIQALDGELR